MRRLPVVKYEAEGDAPVFPRRTLPGVGSAPTRAALQKTVCKKRTAMYIASLHLRNFGQFADLEIPFWPDDKDGPRVTVLIGENGSGKSTLVDGATTLLSWLVARIRSDKGTGSPIEELRIRNGSSEAEVTTGAWPGHARGTGGRRKAGSSPLPHWRKCFVAACRTIARHPCLSLPITLRSATCWTSPGKSAHGINSVK